MPINQDQQRYRQKKKFGSYAPGSFETAIQKANTYEQAPRQFQNRSRQNNSWTNSKIKTRYHGITYLQPQLYESTSTIQHFEPSLASNTARAIMPNRKGRRIAFLGPTDTQRMCVSEGKGRQALSQPGLSQRTYIHRPRASTKYK